VKVLVTGADGFVGRWLVRRLLDDGREVYAAVRPTAPPPPSPPASQTPPPQGDGLSTEERAAVRWLPLELTDGDSVRLCVDLPYDAVVHLAAVASGADSLRDPGYAWTVNAAGTARIAHVLGEARRTGRADPLVLLVSTSEVYGRGAERPRLETDAVAPVSPYAASKLGAETALLETWRRTGLRGVIARPFAHTGPGQDPRFVVPALVQRLKLARRLGAPVVKVGNLEPVREFLHVQDVVEAYARLVSKGQPGEIYNVASGRGQSLERLLEILGDLVGVRPIPEVDPELMRATDIPHLVGDASKLRLATGWTPRHSLEETLKDVVDAQAN
jgi:GDP-4-dehydro-6-deoxy-D-mannose reductase